MSTLKEVQMASRKTDWIARISVPAGHTLDELLKTSLSLDVWQRETDSVVAVASDETLDELERRRLALVDRMYTVGDYLERAGKRSQPAFFPSHGRIPNKHG